LFVIWANLSKSEFCEILIVISSNLINFQIQMDSKEQSDELTNAIMTKVEVRFAELQLKIETLEAVKPTPNLAAYIIQQIHQINKFKQQHETEDLLLQQQLDALQRQIVEEQSEQKMFDAAKHRDLNAQKRRETDYNAALRENGSLKANLASSQLSEAKTNEELARVKAELQKAITAMNFKTTEIRNLEATVNIDQQDINTLKWKLQTSESELAKVKNALRKANAAAQRKAEEIKRLKEQLAGEETDSEYMIQYDHDDLDYYGD
jgi:chromosome segregation ATPase